MSMFFRPPDGIIGGRDRPLTAQDILPASATVQELIAVKSILNKLATLRTQPSANLKALLQSVTRGE